MSKPIDNSEDVIDSRDVIERIAYLERTRTFEVVSDKGDVLGEFGDPDAAQEFIDSLPAGPEKEFCSIDGYLDEDEEEELRVLKLLADESESSPDWNYGETLIRDTYFKDYAMDLADELHPSDWDASWPMTCIDWDQAARELQHDYTSVDFDGVTYWIRS